MFRTLRLMSLVFGTAYLVMICSTIISASADDKPKQKKNKKNEPAEINPVGQPHFDQGKGTGYAIWYDDGVWHLRMTARDEKGAKDKEVFTGTLHIDGGSILNAGPQGLDRAKKAEDADWVIIHANRKGCDFRIANFGKTDGFDFKVSDTSKTITFKLFIGGGEHPQRIKIGKKGQHPEKVPFQLPAHPKKENPDDPPATKKAAKSGSAK